MFSEILFCIFFHIIAFDNQFPDLDMTAFCVSSCHVTADGVTEQLYSEHLEPGSNYRLVTAPDMTWGALLY